MKKNLGLFEITYYLLLSGEDVSFSPIFEDETLLEKSEINENKITTLVLVCVCGNSFQYDLIIKIMSMNMM